MKIRFNKPYLSGKELEYIAQTIDEGKISGNHNFTKKCQQFFEEKYGFRKCLLTTSCTDALEMSALLLNIKNGDEVIVPSYTFVSTANPFILRGAKIVFADSTIQNPNIDADQIESLITPKTKGIVIVHYAGIACDMDKIMNISEKYNVPVIEDAAQAIDSFHKSKVLGSFGAYAAFSFHETKNIVSGEGGMLVVNKSDSTSRAEIIWEKGTNRSAFFRGEVNKYGWVDIGSSFLSSDILAAYLYAQLENLDKIQNKRIQIWQKYYDAFEGLEDNFNIKRPILPDYATSNGHLFYLICNSLSERSKLIKHLKSHEIHAVFHYQSLHASTYFKDYYKGPPLIYSDLYTECLVRLPLYFELTNDEQQFIIEKIYDFYDQAV